MIFNSKGMQHGLGRGTKVGTVWFVAAALLSAMMLAPTKVQAHPLSQHATPERADSASADTLRVMSFNIWVGGEPGGQPLEQTAKVITEAQADIVGLQEGLGRERENGERPENSRKLAEMLGWHYAYQRNGRAILSRYPIQGLTPGKEGAEITLPSGESLFIFNVHLPAAPYQPYQLLRIPYHDAPFLETEEELIQAAIDARGKELQAALDEIEPMLAQGKNVVLTGDFNEPSHLDWTERAAEAGVVPMKVAYPTTGKVVETGLVDAYRTVHPDEVSRRGLTWTPTTTEDDPEDRHDRIDMVFVSPEIDVLSCRIVGESEKYADLVATPYPSDHRAVVAGLRLR